MDIGEKLKRARTNAALTQEHVAEQIGVSRQTISNWENNRSYPDIVSVIELSDLYSMSLDELLKGDQAMINHLEESTNTVKSRNRFSKQILMLAYMIIWAFILCSFWLGTASDDAMGFSLLAFYLVLPLTTIVVSIFIGKDASWGVHRFTMPVFFGLMFMLAGWATFDLANTVDFGTMNAPDPTMLIPGFVCSYIGVGIGLLIRRLSESKTADAR